MKAVDQMGGRVCFRGNFDERFMLHSLRDNNAWMVVLLACVIHKACVCAIITWELQYRLQAQYICLRHSALCCYFV